MFERFEVLDSLAHLERNEMLNVKQALAGEPRNGWDLDTGGRAGWHEQNADKIISELQAEQTKTALLKAGFGKGDSEFLENVHPEFWTRRSTNEVVTKSTRGHVLAHMWLNLAAAQSGKASAKIRDFAARLMTPAQIAEAQEWKPKKERDKG
jgi:hypothetical protein